MKDAINNKNETNEPFNASTTLTSDLGFNESENNAAPAPPKPPLNSNFNQKFRKQLHYFSKINKFSFSCILDLIASDESLKEFLAQVTNTSSVIQIFLRFNWYSFYELDTNSYFNIIKNAARDTNNQLKQPQKQQSTAYDTQKSSANKARLAKQTFLYNHLLLPKIDEFNWHLKDEVYQFEKFKFENLPEFVVYKNHIKQGVLNNYNSFNFKEIIKIPLSKHKAITTTSIFDAPPKTNASKLPPTLKTTTSTRIEEDKSVLNVDAAKFLLVFRELFRKLGGAFYECKLEQIDDKNYYLICYFREKPVDLQAPGAASSNKIIVIKEELGEFNFKILIKVQTKKIKKKLGVEGVIAKHKNSSLTLNTLSAFESNIIASSTTSATNKTLANMLLVNDGTGNVISSTGLNLPPPSSGAKIPVFSLRKSVVAATENQYPKSKPLHVSEELAINKFLIKSYFAFNHLKFQFDQSLINRIKSEFKSEINGIVNLTYLALVLKEIHDTRKWNNLLKLNGKVLLKLSFIN